MDVPEYMLIQQIQQATEQDEHLQWLKCFQARLKVYFLIKQNYVLFLHKLLPGHLHWLPQVWGKMFILNTKLELCWKILLYIKLLYYILLVVIAIIIDVNYLFYGV